MVVIDTSIVYKWITEEGKELNNPALKLFHKFIEGEEKLIVPDIALYELANALATKTPLTLNDIEKAWGLFKDLQLKVINPDLKFIEDCLKFAKKYYTSVYDASFAVLAKQKKCDFITADSKFVRQVNLPFIKNLV